MDRASGPELKLICYPQRCWYLLPSLVEEESALQ